MRTTSSGRPTQNTAVRGQNSRTQSTLSQELCERTMEDAGSVLTDEEGCVRSACSRGQDLPAQSDCPQPLNGNRSCVVAVVNW